MTISMEREPGAAISRRLLESASALSLDPESEVDWDVEAPGTYGFNPEWSSLYGTPYWSELTEEQRQRLTFHEVCSVMSTGIWFEMLLQQMILRDQYVKDYSDPRFRFALTEIADECRHSKMFARACETFGIKAYIPKGHVVELGRLLKTIGNEEIAYCAILTAEEILDVMQRDWMKGENVHPVVRATSRIHVIEESRHMRFARQEVRSRLRNAGRARRMASSLVVAAAAYYIVTSMINDNVYADAGLDAERGLREAGANAHRRAMLRGSCSSLMDFLGEAGMLTRPASAVFRRCGML